MTSPPSSTPGARTGGECRARACSHPPPAGPGAARWRRRRRAAPASRAHAARSDASPTPSLAACSLDSLPLYGAGISSGASFLLKLPRQIKVGAWAAGRLAAAPRSACRPALHLR